MSTASQSGGTGLSSVPAPVVARMPGYLQALDELAAAGQQTVSSEELAGRCAVGSAILRRDLSHLDFAGRRGVGYDTAALGGAVRRFLGLDRTRRIAIAGAGRLGSAIADYAAVRFSGFELTAVFDTAPEVVGTTVGGAPVLPVEQLASVTTETGIEMLIIAVPAPAAQAVADAAVAAGITGLLNFAPTMVTVPEDVHVRHVDLATELRVLAHYTAPAQPAGIDSTDLRNTRPREHAL
ncbi:MULTISPECIES: redox-sensing transcriptional repressor Rex [Brevibacterium]|nr:redox-sensing transcriptional repressor Rex [Brevibacterium casei]MBM7530662.1 redox-sensing transcriptional repressor [Brevibacterium luteolum]